MCPYSRELYNVFIENLLTAAVVYGPNQEIIIYLWLLCLVLLLYTLVHYYDCLNDVLPYSKANRRVHSVHLQDLLLPLRCVREPQIYHAVQYV